MGASDRIMNDMLSSEKVVDTGGQKVDLFKKEPLVPRVDKHVGKKRWGVDTPMFDNKQDMHSFLQDLGMAPGGLGADFLDAALYMSEGEFQEALISIGAAVPLLGMGATLTRKGKKAYDTSKATMKYGGHKQKKERFMKGLRERFGKYEKEHLAEQAKIAEDLSYKKAQRHWDFVDTKVALQKRNNIKVGHYEVPKGGGLKDPMVLSKREQELLKKFDNSEAGKFVRENNVHPNEAHLYVPDPDMAKYQVIKEELKMKIPEGLRARPMDRGTPAFDRGKAALKKLSGSDDTVDEITDLLHRIDK